MEIVQQVRDMYFRHGQNISEIAEKMGLNWKTVQKYVDKTDFNTPPETIKEAEPPFPKLTPYKAEIDNWLRDDKKAPRKQRHTSKRVYDRLCELHNDFDCSYRLVAEYVSHQKEQLRLSHNDAYIPLEHRPGEAQGDFGEADFYENERQLRGKYFVMTFPYSNSGYLQLNYGENLECLLEAIRSIFEHIGGVPTEIWFDNTRTIVSKLVKDGRIINERFARFCEHYGFKAVFMNPASGWEKGSVENKVGYDRRNMLVPIPRFKSLAEYNRELLTRCDSDHEREHYRFDETIGERQKADKEAFPPLPAVPFDTASYMTVHTNNCGKFTLHNGLHEYSASPAYADRDVCLKLTSRTIVVMDMNQHEIVTHRRLYGDTKQHSMDWLPYLRYIALRPRSLRNSGIYDMFPETMRQYIDSCASSERGKVLKALSELTDRSGFESALNTVHEAIGYQATDEDSLRNLYRRLYTDLPDLPPMKAHSDVPVLGQMAADLKAYDELLVSGEGAQ